MDYRLEGLYNELICLCEIRGELSPAQNEETEARIKELKREIQKLESEEEG